MTSKAALNNALTSCYGSSLVRNNYPRLYYQISSKLEVSAISLPGIKYRRSFRHQFSVSGGTARFGRARESVRLLLPFR